jgi:hypothetical protein
MQWSNTEVARSPAGVLYQRVKDPSLVHRLLPSKCGEKSTDCACARSSTCVRIVPIAYRSKQALEYLCFHWPSNHPLSSHHAFIGYTWADGTRRILKLIVYGISYYTHDAPTVSWALPPRFEKPPHAPPNEEIQLHYWAAIVVILSISISATCSHLSCLFSAGFYRYSI